MALRLSPAPTTPFTTSGNISIVNSHYSQYGHSVVASHTTRGYVNRRLPESNINNNVDIGIGIDSIVDDNITHSNDDDGETSFKRPKFNYRSLLIDNNVTKFLKQKLTIDSDNFSLFSSKSANFANVSNLPLEIMKLIINYIDDYKTIVNCLYVNKSFYESSKFKIYFKPKLSSSYRVAQLVTSLKENPLNGELIKVLDLSNLSSGLIINDSYIEQHQDQFSDLNSIHSNFNNGDDLYLDYAFASWRDWKFKNDPLYGSSLLNSYNLSKTKSVVSINSMSTVTTTKLKILQKLKVDVNGELTMKLTKLKNKLFIFKKGSSLKKFKNEIKKNDSMSRQPTIKSSNNITLGKSVKFKPPRNIKDQPFYEKHPYTNKFLLKYSSSKDIPIGYLLYFIELCPNLIDLNLSSVSLSDDWKVEYHTDESKIMRFSSLIEDVLPSNQDLIDNNLHENIKPRFLSDSNIYLKKLTNVSYELVKLQEGEILNQLANLKHLKSLNLSSISWLNYKKMNYFKRLLIENSIKWKNGGNITDLESIELSKINLTNSGMYRNLKWAKKFESINEFINYFMNEDEPKSEDVQEIDEEMERELFVRRIGMNY